MSGYQTAEPFTFNGQMYDPDVVTLNGGEGGKTIATGLSKTQLKVAYFGGVHDSGGWTKKQREPDSPVEKDPTKAEYYHDIPAVGDLRRIMGALLPPNSFFSEIFNYRMKGGPADDTPIGSLLLDVAARLKHADLETACLRLSEELRIAPALPITSTPVHLCGRWHSTGDVFYRERDIDNAAEQNWQTYIDKVWLSNPVELSPAFRSVMLTGKRKVFVIGPGSLIGSKVGALLTDGLKEVVDQANPWILYVSNLATVRGETFGLSVRQHIEMINAHLGRHKIDEVLVNNAPAWPAMLAQYESKGQQYLLPQAGEFTGMDILINADNYLSSSPLRPDIELTEEEIRNIARHDNWKVAGKIYEAVERLRQAA